VSTATLGSTLPSDRVVAFGVFLRRHGFLLGPGELADMLRVASWPESVTPRAVSAAWRAIACRNAAEWKTWGDVFDRFWMPHRVRGTVRVSGYTPSRRDLRQMVAELQAGGESESGKSTATSGSTLATSISSEGEGVERAMGGASAVDPLHDRSGQWWQPEELAELKRLARQIYRRLKPRSRRRRIVHPSRGRVDLRRTLRRAVGTGASLQPVLCHPATEPPPLLVWIDVSRSMEAFAVFGLRAARALVNAGHARVFVFHTRGAEITDLLRRDSARVQEKINAITGGFSGGTRIASTLEEFLRRERGALTRGARVWIFSDGYDTDEPVSLRRVLDRWTRRGARISWLHPTQREPAATAYRMTRSRLDLTAPLATLTDLRALARRVR
jgi:uncharacterized protein with von Willebrand factor type A (vWA) domain